MKNVRVFRGGWLVILLPTAALVAIPVRAQGEVYLRTVEPATGSPGQELELTLQGGGFGGTNEVRVTIGELQIEESEWEVELTAVDHFPTTFRGPEASESPTAYRALLEAHLGVYVHDLIREVGRLF